MSPCEVEIRAQNSQKWVPMGHVGPEDRDACFSTFKDNKVREIVVFECAPDDSETRIFRSGLVIEWSRFERESPDFELLELVKTLRKGESYEMPIKTDSGTRAVVRFSHR